MANADIETRVRSFVSDLEHLIRKAALEAVHDALAGGSPRSALPVAAKKRGRPPGKSAAVKAAKPKVGQKRDPRALEALVTKLEAHIKANPGKRIEEINKALGVETRELALPVKKLIAKKAIKTKGQKRSTTYFPAGSGEGGLVQVRKAKKPDAEGEG